MRDDKKTKENLLQEIDVLRRSVAELKQAETASGQSERQLKKLFENLPVGIYRTTPAGRIIMANRAFVRMLGFSSFKELSGKNVNDEGFAPGYPRAAFRDLLEKDGEVFGFQSEFVGRDGKTMFVRENARAIRDTDGKVLYYEGAVEDISGLQKAANDAKILRDQIEFILGATKTGLDIIDSQFNIRFIDREWQRIYGDPKGKKCYQYFMDRRRRCPDCGVVKALQTKKVAVTEKVLVKEDNRPIQATTIPFQDTNGEWLVAEVNVDVTEQRRNEDILQAILDATTETMFLVDRELNIVAANKTGAKRFGRTPEQLVGLHTGALVPHVVTKDLFDTRTRLISKVFSSGKPIRVEDERADRAFDTHYYPVFDANGAVSNVAIFGKDVTEQKKAEDSLRAAFNATTESILLVDNHLKVLTINKIGAERLGKTPQQLIGLYIPDLFRNVFSPDEIKRRTEHAKNVIKTGKPFHYKVKMAEKVFDSSLYPVYDAQGKVSCLAIFAKDITQQKTTDDALRESELRFRTIFDNTSDGIFLSDLKGTKISMCNKAFSQMLGYTQKELVNLTLEDLHPKEDLPFIRSQIRQFKKGRKWMHQDIRFKRKDGSILFTDLSPNLITLSLKKYVLIAVRDITESKRAKAFSEKMAQTERLASLGTLSATIAHELAQPLSVIGLSIENALEELRTAARDRAVTKQLKNSLSGVAYMTSVIHRVRNFARSTSYRSVGRVDLNAVAERIAELLNERALSAKVSLLIKNMDKLPAITANEKDVEQLFFILLDNAIQAADGKKDRKVQISGDVKCGRVELRLSDNCGGIAPEHIKRLFEPFFTTKPPGEGTGLGLCIAKRIADEHGGNIRVKSRTGIGSTFFVTLPVKN